MASTESILQGVNVLGAVQHHQREILTPQALAFLALLQRSFNGRRKELLERRKIRQADLDRGALLDFLPETKHIRDDPTWKAAPPAPGLVDRRVEITGPTDRKMVINALNSDVWTYMADFEGLYYLFIYSFPFLIFIAISWWKIWGNCLRLLLLQSCPSPARKRGEFERMDAAGQRTGSLR